MSTNVKLNEQKQLHVLEKCTTVRHIVYNFLADCYLEMNTLIHRRYAMYLWTFIMLIHCKCLIVVIYAPLLAWWNPIFSVLFFWHCDARQRFGVSYQMRTAEDSEKMAERKRKQKSAPHIFSWSLGKMCPKTILKRRSNVCAFNEENKKRISTYKKCMLRSHFAQYYAISHGLRLYRS